MILTKISLVLTVIFYILTDFAQSMLEMQYNLGIILHRGPDRHILGYASATMSIRRYMYHIYLCIVHSIRRGRIEYLKRARWLDKQEYKEYDYDALLDHALTYWLVYILVAVWTGAFISVFLPALF